MKKTKKMNVVLAMVLSLILLFGATISANAASAEVKFDVKVTDINLSVNVPTTLPIIFNEDGTNTYPTNWEIQNVGNLAGVYLKTVELEATDAGWIVLDKDENVSTLPADTKAIKFKMGKEGALRVVEPRTSDNPSLGLMNLTEDEITIPAGSSQVIQFEVERGAFTKGISSRTTFNMILTFKYI
ncbi:MAG: hypothetical protein IJZ53_06290 [Tyzzerella sp.]|nr:hypothetical protein [Tyzzerella sp.]